jgi:hypothetical protein
VQCRAGSEQVRSMCRAAAEHEKSRCRTCAEVQRCSRGRADVVVQGDGGALVLSWMLSSAEVILVQVIVQVQSRCY